MDPNHLVANTVSPILSSLWKYKGNAPSTMQIDTDLDY